MNFFVLENNFCSGDPGTTDFLPVDGSKTGDAPRCVECGNYIGGLPLLPPINVELEVWGKTFGDIAFGPSDEVLVSHRFLKLYQASSLSGLIQVAPVELTKIKSRQKLSEPVPRYYCCQASRQSRAAIDDVASELERELPAMCQECRLGGIIKRAQRIVLEPNSWSGEDIFFARGLSGTILVSERFVLFCEKHRFTNCVLIPAEQFSFDYYSSER